MGFGTSPIEQMACDAMIRGLVFLDEFVYSASFVASTDSELKSLGTNQVSIQIDAGADFVAQSLNLTAYDNNNAYLETPNYLLTIIRGGSGRELMNQAQHVLNVAGNYRHVSGEKPCPGLITSMSQLTVRLQNLTTVVPKRVDIALLGFKVFYLASENGTGDRRTVFHAM